MITLIISDDHKIFREELKSLIQSYSDEFKILFEASSVSSTTTLNNETKPDIIKRDNHLGLQK
jgi:DNA-binding NarL/FixJ family response regulator